MTGFGRSQGSHGALDLSLEINSVNRRNLETTISLPREWQSLDRDIQQFIRERFDRGKFHVALQAVPCACEGGFQWDQAGLDACLQRMGEVAARYGISWPPDADALVRLAALHKVEAVLPDAGEIRTVLETLLEAACRDLLLMRETEGQRMGDDLFARLNALHEALRVIRKESAGTVPHYREHLFQRLANADLELDLSDDRVLKEIAIFADRCDTAEEQTRLESHFDQIETCLKEGSPVGRKLEFILQEINREFNTIGSKANNIEVNRAVIEAKNEVERIREQIQNIE